VSSLLPFWVRRPFLLIRDLLANRDAPDLAALGQIEDPEEFLWAILPHAARTFAACIALLPARSARAAAVAYLYSRMLDTYEDLVADPADRDRLLLAFADRFAVEGPDGPAPAPHIDRALDRDPRDRAHLLLVRRAALVDRVYRDFDPDTRGVIRDLVQEMSGGMRWSNAVFAETGGVLATDERLREYCRHVLGNPVVFSVRLMRIAHGAPPQLAPREREDAMRVGEMVQLANITRDVEKDLRRGVAYDPSLREFLGVETAHDDRRLAERCRAVRERLLRMALLRAPAYGRIIEALQLPRWSVARASAVLMLLFTERYFRQCATRVGVRSWDGPNSGFALFARSIPATFSARGARREIRRIEQAFLDAAAATRAPDLGVPRLTPA
jgi:phytoene/squalene synthetase